MWWNQFLPDFMWDAGNTGEVYDQYANDTVLNNISSNIVNGFGAARPWGQDGTLADYATQNNWSDMFAGNWQENLANGANPLEMYMMNQASLYDQEIPDWMRQNILANQSHLYQQIQNMYGITPGVGDQNSPGATPGVSSPAPQGNATSQAAQDPNAGSVNIYVNGGAPKGAAQPAQSQPKNTTGYTPGAQAQPAAAPSGPQMTTQPVTGTRTSPPRPQESAQSWGNGPSVNSSAYSAWNAQRPVAPPSSP